MPAVVFVAPIAADASPALESVGAVNLVHASQRLSAFQKVAVDADPVALSAVFSPLRASAAAIAADVSVAAIPVGGCRVFSRPPIVAAVNLADVSEVAFAAALFDAPTFAVDAALAGGPVVFEVPADAC